MDFDFSSDQKLLRDEARRFFTDQSSPQIVRAALDGGGSNLDLWDAVAEMGFTGAAIPEEFGGLGLGYLELCVIAEEMGRTLAPIPFSSSIHLAAELILRGGDMEQKQALLPDIASGNRIGCLAHAESGDQHGVRVDDGRLTGVKLPVLDGDIADIAIVSAREESGMGLYIVDLADVAREPVATIDPTRGHALLRFDATPAQRLGANDHNALLAGALDRAAVLCAFEQLGGADVSLETARDYALERMAFGRQIGSFQAIKHMLADMYVSATLARSNCYYAAWALASDADELPCAAATARVSATQAFQHCARNAIQVHGGIGFTWESPCHLYYRRANLLAASLGSLSHWESLLIDRLPLAA